MTVRGMTFGTWATSYRRYRPSRRQRGKFTVSQRGHEDLSHEQRPLYLKDDSLWGMGSHVRTLGPPSAAAPYAALIVTQGPCKPLIKR